MDTGGDVMNRTGVSIYLLLLAAAGEIALEVLR
jgi:hypothetical protein